MKWIWVSGEDSTKVQPRSVAVFRYEFELPHKPDRAALFLMARGDWKATVNGQDAGAKSSWDQFDRREIISSLVKGRNTVDITVTVPPPPPFGPDAGPPDSPRLAELAALIKVTDSDADHRRTDVAYKTAAQ
jgi:hypothetical protein